MIKVIYLNISGIMQIDDIIKKYFRNLVNEETYRRYLESIDRTKARAIIFGEIILKYLGTFVLKSDLENVHIGKEHGKPVIMNLKGYYISLSHSDTYVMAVVGNRPVGCDIEKIRTINKRAISMFLSERDFVFIQNSEMFDQRFTDIWTRRESFIKLLSEEINLKTIDFSNKAQIAFIYNVNFYSKVIDEKYIATVAHNTKESQVEFEKIDILMLLQGLR